MNIDPTFTDFMKGRSVVLVERNDSGSSMNLKLDDGTSLEVRAFGNPPRLAVGVVGVNIYNTHLEFK